MPLIRRYACALSISALLVAVALAQQAPFRSEVDLIVVDVAVVDSRGRPIAGLTPVDFAVKVDGKPRRVVSAAFVTTGGSTSSGGGLAASVATLETRRTQLFSTNDSSTPAAVGRLILIVVDELHITMGGGKAVLAAAGRFLDRLTPADRVGLVVLPVGSPAVEFTVNRAAVREALGRVAGRATPQVRMNNITLTEAFQFLNNDTVSWKVVQDRECNRAEIREVCESQLAADARRIALQSEADTAQSIRALRGIVVALGRLEGPKTLILVSQGLPVSGQSRFQSTFYSEASTIAEAAARGRVSVFSLRIDSSFDSLDASVDVPSHTASSDTDIARHGLDTVTGMARGTVMNVVGTGDAAFERLALETSAYYLLGVEPAPDDRDGRRHRIEVDVSAKGASVRARREFSAADTAPEPVSSPEVRAKRLLRTFDRPNDLPLAVATYLLKDRQTGRLRVVIVAEVDQNVASGEEVAVGYLLRDSDDNVAGATTELATLTPADAPTPSPLAFTTSVLVTPGRYTLRLVAVDRKGRQGAVEHPVNTRLASAERLEFTDLMVASGHPGRSGPTQLSVRGIVRDSLPVYLEIYGRARSALERLAVTMELSAADEEPAIVSAAARTSEPRSGAGALMTAEAALPLRMLPPGDYLARALIRDGTRTLARVVRPVRVTRFVATTGAGGPSAAATIAGTSVEAFRLADLLEPEVANHFLERAETIVGGERPTELAGALAAAREGRFEEAARAVTGMRGSAMAAFVRGLGALARRDLDAASIQFREALKEASDLFPAIVYLGACYAAGGHHQDAAGAWQMALLTEGDRPILFRLIADARLRAGDGAGAREILVEASGIWPDDDSLQRRLAAAYLAAGQEKEAAATLGAYVDRRPDDAAALLLAIGLVYSAHSEGRAIESLDRDIERARGWAAKYAAAGGDQQPLVVQWLKFLESRKR